MEGNVFKSLIMTLWLNNVYIYKVSALLKEDRFIDNTFQKCDKKGVRKWGNINNY